MSAAVIERLSAIALVAQNAAHGERGLIYQAACAELGISLQTLHRKLAAITVRPTRKRRADAGVVSLTQEEAEIISAYVMEHIRKNAKKTKSMQAAVEELRFNGIIVAGRVDTETGEIVPLSDSAIQRALRGYGLHPEQLLAPDPVMTLISKHPNHVWQIDASLCVLYKLPDQPGYGITEVESTEKYKNKLSHFAKIEHRLVQRYLITDHASCAAFLYFAFGGESTESLCMLLVQAIQQRGRYPFYGIPVMIYLDRGSANRSATFKNLCKALGIRLEFAQRARAKGQVEKMHDVIEMGFESGLKMATEIRTVEQLNQLGQKWTHHFNATRIHSRHGKTRYAAWQLIKPHQLMTTTLNTEQLLLLAREQPVLKKVTPYLTVNFKGAEYDVSKVTGVMVGEKLLITRCAFDAEKAQAVVFDADGHEVFHPLSVKARDEDWGWFVEGAVLGEEHARHADTPAQTMRKKLERLAMNAETDAEAAANRKAKVAPFGGGIDPYKEMNEYQHPAYFPNRETKRELSAPTIERLRMNIVQSGIWLLGRLGSEYRPELLADVKALFPDGPTEEDLERVLVDLAAGRSAGGKAKLKAV
ncbi:MAG: DDE-type integrase/transposase/recombinase [Methylobacter tundripaludum]|nr:DDE-type integrase/transposase/recombinase [Methylobacter tundripaludum]